MWLARPGRGKIRTHDTFTGFESFWPTTQRPDTVKVKRGSLYA